MFVLKATHKSHTANQKLKKHFKIYISQTTKIGKEPVINWYLAENAGCFINTFFIILFSERLQPEVILLSMYIKVAILYLMRLLAAPPSGKSRNTHTIFENYVRYEKIVSCKFWFSTKRYFVHSIADNSTHTRSFVSRRLKIFTSPSQNSSHCWHLARCTIYSI